MKRKLKKVRTTPSFSRFKKLVVPRPDVLHSYLKHRDINLYLDYLQNRYGNFVQVHTLGLSHEHRPLKGIEINWNSPKNLTALTKDAQNQSSGNRSGSNRQNVPPPPSASNSRRSRMQPEQPLRNYVFIEGGTHAREWISISVALNCIYQLTEKNIRNREILRKLCFFIVPLSNPDGYEYSRSKNRRWRKNRRPHPRTKHVGTDCNRNYDFHWDQGSSKLSRNTFKGERPFSEPETRALRNVLQKFQSRLLFFLSLHSYAQSIMFPWGYTKELPDNWSKLQKLALTGSNAIKAYTGRHYRIGSISTLSKRTISGSIVDYAFGVIKVPLALVMELPALEYGFYPPPEAISPIGHESWFGIREMCKVAYDLVPPMDAGEAEMSGTQDNAEMEEILLKKTNYLDEINRIQTKNDSICAKEQT